MSHTEQRQFCEKVKKIVPDHFENKRVLDVGSLDINGNNRYLFNNCEYLGLDVGEGKNVDVVSKAHEYNPEGKFDTIISTEMLEHDKYYKESLRNMFRLLNSGGLLLLTCATTGRAEHGTNRTRPQDAPLIEWGDYYKNLTEDDIRESLDLDLFLEYYFEVNNQSKDLYFYGVKK